MTPAECAARANVSPSLIYAVLLAGRLKAMRVGCRGRGKWLVRPDDFEAWLASCKVTETVPEDDGDYKYL